jgi:alanine racemase
MTTAERDADGRSAVWQIPGRSTRAVVDLDAIAGNLAAFRRELMPATRLMAVVKANAYGHGARMIARASLEAGASDLAVATVEEGVQLRRANISAPILILGPIDHSEIERALDANLVLAVGDRTFVEATAAAAAAASRGPVSVHLKVDTGMRRYGTPPAEAAELASLIASLPSLRLAGMFTHFASADEPDETETDDQIATFDAAISSVRDRGVEPGLLHVANSAATLRHRRYDYDMVRIGISLYGIAPSGHVGLWRGMRPALTVRSRVRRVILLREGDRVSYGGTYRAERDEFAALIPIGYADGYHRLLSNRAWMGVDNSEAPVRGRICMDQTVVGWPSDLPLEVNREVVVVGNGDDAAPTLAQLAELAGTIPYELATSLAPRVPRFYLRHGRVVAIEDLFGLRVMVEEYRKCGDEAG